MSDLAEASPSRAPFWLNRGSKKAKAKVAGKYGAGTIWELPPSAVNANRTDD